MRLKDIRKKEKKKALREENFIYYNNLHRIICKNPVRKIKPSKIKVSLIITDNNKCQVRKLPGSIIPNMVRLINLGITINGSLGDLITRRGYKN